MIDREKVIRGLECCNAPNRHEGCPYDGAAHYNICTHHLLTDAIALLREQEGTGWVSAQDRLPEEEGEYIASDGETVFGAYYEIGTSGTRWTDATEGYWEYKVTHWRPMPEPPEGVSGND